MTKDLMNSLVAFNNLIKDSLNRKSDLKATLIFTGQFLIYLLCLVMAIADSSIILNLFFSVYLGLVLGQLFIIGHDACHQSLAKSSLLNKIIGRLAFSFVLHSYTLWNLEHNINHHTYTNIRGKDPSWSPLTKIEFDQKSKVRQLLERLYRSPIGAGIYYMLEMGLKIHGFPINLEARSQIKKHLFDSFLVVLALIVYPCLILTLGRFLSPEKSLPEILLLGWVIPLLTWNWLMGFAIYLHHTHPAVPWFDQFQKVPFRQTQILTTVHVVFPQPFQTLFYNIMEHTAHHLQPSIPMDKLYFMQQKLNNAHGAGIISYKWTIEEYLRITKICKLFDPERNCWTDFDGNPTSSIITTLISGK